MFAHISICKVKLAERPLHSALIHLALFSLLRVNTVHLLYTRTCVRVFNLKHSYVCVRCAARVWSVLRFPAEWKPLHTLSCQAGKGRLGGAGRREQRDAWGQRQPCLSHREQTCCILHGRTTRNLDTSHRLFSLFGLLLFFSSFPFTDSGARLGSDPRTRRDEGGNYGPDMRIFCILLNRPARKLYTSPPCFA